MIRTMTTMVGDLGKWELTDAKPWTTGERQVVIDGGFAYVTAEQAERLSEQWYDIAQAIRAMA